MQNRVYIVVEDVWLNTHADAAEAVQPDPTWEEVEEANRLINPDKISMESRG